MQAGYQRQLQTKAGEVNLKVRVEEALSYYKFPREHWCCLRTNNHWNDSIREIRRQTRVVGTRL
jgi:transposase-like protein